MTPTTPVTPIKLELAKRLINELLTSGDRSEVSLLKTLAAAGIPQETIDVALKQLEVRYFHTRNSQRNVSFTQEDPKFECPIDLFGEVDGRPD